LSVEAAHFQARSALTGVGFTTSESELIVGHPARRRIVESLVPEIDERHEEEDAADPISRE